MPLMKLEKLWLFSETPSLLSIISDLWADSEILLAIVVLAFSILFPIAKLATVFQAVFKGGPAAGWASALAKWSMMDVLLVAIVIVAAKTSGMANAFSQPGLWFYAASALLTIMAHQAIKKL